MSEEYLWDKSGEPDPEIQQLEEILGTLKYQPKPLNLPDDIKPVRRSRYLPLVAIAATLLVALLAGVVWLRARNDSTPQQRQALSTPTPTPPGATPPSEITEQIVENRSTGSQRVATTTSKRSRGPAKLSAAERKQAIEAKEQLMVALRLASEKLNLAQRKTHGPATPSQIRNQHKVG